LCAILNGHRSNNSSSDDDDDDDEVSLIVVVVRLDSEEIHDGIDQPFGYDMGLCDCLRKFVIQGPTHSTRTDITIQAGHMVWLNN